ncbi:MAG: Bug family tripartite tricarboxylate transporter substrate binding protein [Hyphomicrobiaceae bacterium]
MQRAGSCRLSAALVTATALAFSVLGLAAPVEAAWPDKPVKVVVPFAPGGSSDIFARTIQKVLADKKMMPQPLTVINVGGHFSVGSVQVKNAAADGYNFLLIHPALLIGEVVSPERKLSYRDFEPVALTGGFCTNYIVREDSPWKTLKEFVAAAKAKPGEIVTGVNIGALNHMAAGMLEEAAGIKLRYAQIGGGAENYAALRGGTVQFIILSTSEYQTYKGSGIRALALAAPARHPMQSDVPTATEAGFTAEFCVNSYWFAPKGTPKEALAGMTAVLEAAMKSPEVKEVQDRQASTVEFVGGDAFKKHLDDMFQRIEPVAKQLVKK